MGLMRRIICNQSVCIAPFKLVRETSKGDIMMRAIDACFCYVQRQKNTYIINQQLKLKTSTLYLNMIKTIVPVSGKLSSLFVQDLIQLNKLQLQAIS